MTATEHYSICYNLGKFYLLLLVLQTPILLALFVTPPQIASYASVWMAESCVGLGILWGQLSVWNFNFDGSKVLLLQKKSTE